MSPPRQKDIDLRLDSIMNMIESLTNKMENSFEKMEEKITKVSDDVSNVKSELIELLKHEVNEVRIAQSNFKKEVERDRFAILNMVNDLEQYGRSRSIRISGLSLPPKDHGEDTMVKTTYNEMVVKIAYDKVIKPMLDKVYSKREESTPSLWKVIEYGHILPGPPHRPAVAAIRFRSEFFAKQIWGVKKDFSSMLKSSSIYINPSVTRMNGKKMAELRKDPGVKAVWFNGKINFKLKDDETIFTIKRVEDQINNIINVTKRAEDQIHDVKRTEDQCNNTINATKRVEDRSDPRRYR